MPDMENTPDFAPYLGQFTGEEIDELLGKVRDGGAGGVGKSLAGEQVQPAQGVTVTAGEGAEIFNDYAPRTYGTEEGETEVVALTGNVASGKYAHAENSLTTASGYCSHAEGMGPVASGAYSHAEGRRTVASGYGSHTEGFNTTASDDGCHAEGSTTVASGRFTHAEGSGCKAEYICAHAEGAHTIASGYASHAQGQACEAKGFITHAGGWQTIASGDYQTVIGKNNVESKNESDRLIVGKGETDGSRSNCLRVTDTGTYASGSYNASGADYAELFQWEDGNPNEEDRAGRFVTLEGEKIRLAGPGDDYILGIVSGNPSVVGDVYDDQWQGMYETDVFGRPVWEDIKAPDRENPPKDEGHALLPVPVERRQKQNPDYDPGREYIPRTRRPEWDAVGLVGKLVVVDDGSCRVNGWCRPKEKGIAGHSPDATSFRVMARLDDTHIRVMVL